MSAQEKMHFKIGSPVMGGNFFPRPETTEEITEALEEDHVSFLAPRRTGKTSILFYLRDQSEEERTFFFLNLEKFESPEEWIEEMLCCLFREKKFHSFFRSLEIWGSIRNFVDGLEFEGFKVKLREWVGKDWKKAAEEFFRALSKEERSVVFLLDEFPILVNRVARKGGPVEGMLRWFRDWRQENQSGKVKFLVTGSIGLDAVVRRLKLGDTINDFHSVELLPLGEKKALDMIRKLGGDNGLFFPPKLEGQILSRLGPAWPYFLQVFLSELKNWQRREESEICEEVIDQVYEEKLVFGPKNKFPLHMFDRLREVFSPEEHRLAREILKGCSQKSEGLRGEEVLEIHRLVFKDVLMRKEEELEYVLDVLKHDGYLTQSREEEQRIRFFSNMLRDYWHKKGI